ncbi:Cytochrome P450 CYP2 subfamily [Handroanthus impetiginosus]|uniref:(+)-piperitol/(+)-sesamin synthase n=1 Tax=Handroanthus impetiginosus TaxID=429701 RepID=A0A2G9HSJ0_9LAMI|nr:Cytochrome P450 CYP2 subfamily [Handroanthus impetiginosus]
MEVVLFYTSLSLLFIFLILKHLSKKHYNLPPSPAPALPLLGHLHILKQPLHRTLQSFSQTHGPIFSLKFGSRRVVVVSSRKLAEECFTSTNDVVFCNRPYSMANDYFGYNHTTMAGAPYGHHWRNLRRLGAQEVLSVGRLNAFSHIREEEMRQTLRSLTTSGNEFTKVELRPKLFELIFNVIMKMLAGNNYSEKGELGEKFRKMVTGSLEHAQSSNPEDVLPFLRWIDYRGLKKKLIDLGEKLDAMYQNMLEEHRQEKRNTIIGHLLSLQESDPEFYTDQTIKGFITNMIIAGTDTSIATAEWAMSLLLNHPDALQKAKIELDSQIGHQRLVQEQDLPKLHYLRNIIFETFRMFPAVPLAVPHESSADCKVGEYDIPRGTILFLNIWAIQRDPEVWDNPTYFKPERFEGKEDEIQKVIPFGMGRRACPGSNLGQRMVGLILGSLIQCFEWERTSLEEVDLAEGIGITMPKLKPLEARYKPRGIMLNILQDLAI